MVRTYSKGYGLYHETYCCCLEEEDSVEKFTYINSEGDEVVINNADVTTISQDYVVLSLENGDEIKIEVEDIVDWQK